LFTEFSRKHLKCKQVGWKAKRKANAKCRKSEIKRAAK